jgi:hypothetical protein
MSYNTIDLLVEVDERWYTWPIPIFELSDRNFNEWWQNYNHDFGRVNYGLRLEQYNCRGRNETLKLTAQFGFAQRYELSYVIPYLDKRQKQGLILNFEFGALRNLAAQTIDHKIRFLPTDSTVLFDGNPILRNSIQAQATYTYRKSFFETHSFSVGYRANDIFDQVAVYNPNYFNNTTNKQKYTMLSYTFRSEHRDVVMYPLNGYQFSAHIQKNGLGWEGEVNQWILNLTHAYHHDLKKGYNLSNFCSLYLSDPMRFMLLKGQSFLSIKLRSKRKSTPALADGKICPWSNLSMYRLLFSGRLLPILAMFRITSTMKKKTRTHA